MITLPRFATIIAVGTFLGAPILASAADEPPVLAGKWTWTWKDAQGETHRHVLELKIEAGRLVGEERFDDKPAIPVEALEQKDKSISFAVDRDGRHAEYRGKVKSADAIDGLVTVTQDGISSEYGWTAARQADPK